jgi:hypothetical protein
MTNPNRPLEEISLAVAPNRTNNAIENYNGAAKRVVQGHLTIYSHLGKAKKYKLLQFATIM